jgi:phosphoribosyl-ATP pyrophosphohydrolase/phosphoribosyl-AMP cyclohydrolase
MIDTSTLDWDKADGLIPAVIQDTATGMVLMVGYMNKESLAATLEKHRVVFYSRSKQRLWMKGESSGNFLLLDSIQPDCDGDALLVNVVPAGPACHKGTMSCFENAQSYSGFVDELEGIIEERAAEQPQGSYTASLLLDDVHRVAQKVGEEGLEVALAAAIEDREAIVEESADLIYHLMVLLRRTDVKWDDVQQELEDRHRGGRGH